MNSVLRGMLLSTLLAGPAAAEPVIGAYCEPGKGCPACVLPGTREEVAKALSFEKLPETAFLRFYEFEPGFWGGEPVTGISVEELDRALGGSGRGPLPTCADRPELPNTQRPLDGAWKVTQSPGDLSYCAPGTTSELTEAIESQTMRMAWARPFLGKFGPEGEMIQTGPNNFRHAVIQSDRYVTYALHVESPRRLHVTTVVSQPQPEYPGCQIQVEIYLDYLGP